MRDQIHGRDNPARYLPRLKWKRYALTSIRLAFASSVRGRCSSKIPFLYRQSTLSALTSAGNPVVLSWTTSGATSVILTGFGAPAGPLPVNGNVTVNPNTNTDYTLTAYGDGGQSVSVVIHVFVR